MKLIKGVSVFLAIFATSLISFQAGAQWLPDVSIDPDPLTFSDTRVDEVSSEMTITVTNDQGILPLYIFSVKTSDPDIFVIVGDGCSNQTIVEGGSCSLDVQFRPIENEHYSASLSIIGISRGVVNSSKVEGRGVEPLVVLSKNSIDFGDQTINLEGVAHEVVMVNSGSSELSITDISATGQFSVTDDCGDSLAAAASCVLEIDFEPTELGGLTGSVTITSDASDSPQTIALSGKGVEAGQEDAGLSTHSVEFAPVVVEQTSAAINVTLTSTGTVALTGISISTEDNFGVTDDCGTDLPSGDSCTISITFTPPEAADFTGSVVVVSNATDSPQSIALSGIGVNETGPQVSLSVNALDFGEQVVDMESDARSIVLTNSGTETLEIDEVVLGGDGSESYNKHDNCHGSSVVSGESCTISVAFTPAHDGTITATLSITDNSSGSPQSVTVTGVGIESTTSGGCSLLVGNENKISLILLVFPMMLAGLVIARSSQFYR